MAFIQISNILFHTALILLSVRYSYCIDQDEINYMARNLQVTYTVVTNLEPPGMKLIIGLKNTGERNMASQGWVLYFSHIRILEPEHMVEDGGNYVTREGVALGQTNLKLYHDNGVVFHIEPTPQFDALAKGQQIDIYLDAQAWEVARTDVMPNWYVVGKGTEARIVDSTSGQSLDFVTDFTTKEQYKRSNQDHYSPFTSEERYNMFSKVQNNAPYRIVPNVVESSFGNEIMDLGLDWIVMYSDDASKFAAKHLAEKLGIQSKKKGIPDPSSRFIELIVDSSIGKTDICKNNQETYDIDIDSAMEKVTIRGKEQNGVLHGVQSLLALVSLGSGSLKGGSIEDCPRFGYRGMHVDTARNFLPKASVLKLLDTMSMYKLNRFHFHLTDDEGWRLEIPGLEELTEVGARRCHDPTGNHCILPQLGASPNAGGSGSGFYSREDYRQILKYAADRHISVIPEFDMPGHAHAAINAILARKRKTGDETYLLTDPTDNSRYLSVQAFIDNAINPCINSTYKFVTKVVDEVIEMHKDIQPLNVFNFGGDEVARTAWENSTACAKLELGHKAEKKEIKKYFAEKASQVAKEKGLGLAGWEDGLMYDGLHNLPFNLSDLATTEVYAYAWNNIWEWGSGSRAYRLANAGYKTVIAHATNLYFDHPHEPDPEERGYYWSTRFTNTKKTFGFMPDSVYDNIDFDLNGNKITKEEICKDASKCPKLEKKENIVGIQGHLWSETVRTTQQFEDMVYPRFLALAERAWHKAQWESETDVQKRNEERNKDWEEWANLLGHKELMRLDDLDINFHILPPGAILEGNTLKARAEFPGMVVSVSDDNGATWCDIKTQLQVMPGTTLLLRTKSTDGRRYSRTSKLNVPQTINSTGILVSSSVLLTLFWGLLAAACAI